MHFPAGPSICRLLAAPRTPAPQCDPLCHIALQAHTSTANYNCSAAVDIQRPQLSAVFAVFFSTLVGYSMPRILLFRSLM